MGNLAGERSSRPTRRKAAAGRGDASTNLAEYEDEVDVDEQLIEAMLRVAREIEQRLKPLIEGAGGAE